MPKAEVKILNGGPTLLIDDRPVFPMLHWAPSPPVRGNGLENLPAGVLTVSVGAHICTEDIDKCYGVLLNALEMAKTAGGDRVVFLPGG